MDESEVQLWQRVRAGDDEARRILIEQYIPLVEFFACKVYQKSWRYVEYDDLFSDGVIGLIEAVDRFDPALSSRFAPYAALRIRGAILDAIRLRSDRSRREIKRLQLLQKAFDALATELKRIPRDQELAQKLGISLSELVLWQQAVSDQAGNLRLDDVITEGDIPVRFVDILAAHTPDVLDDMVLSEELEEILRRISQLPRPDRELLTRVLNGVSQAQVAKDVGVVAAHISYRLKAVRDGLRQPH